MIFLKPLCAACFYIVNVGIPKHCMLTKYNKKGKIKKAFGGVHLKKEFARKVSDIERFYISLAECGINTTIRCLIKTDKRPPAEIIVAAAKSALRNCKGVNLKYKRGKWFFSDKIPEYLSYRAYCDNVSDSPVSFLNYREYTLRVSEIHHIKTDTYYISVECFHGACDGMSLLNFVYELFAAMDDKKTERFCCNLTDWDIVKGNFVKNGENTDKLVDRIKKVDRVSFINDEHIIRTIQKIVQPLGRTIDSANPMVDSRLPDGSRINAIIPPLSVKGPVMTIRKFKRDMNDIEDLLRMMEKYKEDYTNTFISLIASIYSFFFIGCVFV